MPELDLIDSILALDPSAQVDIRSDGIWMTTSDLDIFKAAQCMAAVEATLSTITATVAPNGETELIYHYRGGKGRRDLALNIKTRTHQNTTLSIAPVCQAAEWIEREIHDLYAVVFTGHPNLVRLIRPPELPEGFFRDDGLSQPDGIPSEK